jgi:hypothetical protein
MRWVDALRAWNLSTEEVMTKYAWSVPRKNTEYIEEVKDIMKGVKPKEVKKRDKSPEHKKLEKEIKEVKKEVEKVKEVEKNVEDLPEDIQKLIYVHEESLEDLEKLYDDIKKGDIKKIKQLKKDIETLIKSTKHDKIDEAEVRTYLDQRFRIVEEKPVKNVVIKVPEIPKRLKSKK